jgi:dUTP pyrophosphatase
MAETPKAKTPINKVGIFLEPGAQMPKTARTGDVGYDLFAMEDVEIPYGHVVGIHTGVHLALPNNLFAQVNTRSGHGSKGKLLLHGVIDSGYTGEVMVWALNIANNIAEPGTIAVRETFTINKGDKVAQLLFHEAVRPELEQIEELPETERGDKGMGSTGK